MEIKYIQSEKTESGYVQVRAVPIVDYSSEYEFSNDNNMHFTMDNNKRGTNHLICLGKGELKDRLVIHLYIDDQGNISQTQYFFGINEIAEIYDSSGSEYEDLLKNGTEKLLKSKSNRIRYDNGENRRNDGYWRYCRWKRLSYRCEYEKANRKEDMDCFGGKRESRV